MDFETAALQARLNAVRVREGETLHHQHTLRSRPSHAIRIAETERLIGETARGRVLDIGCAEGAFCDLARKAGAEHVIGIDVSPAKIARAQASFPECTFHVADAFDPAFYFDSADVVLCFEVLQHLADYRCAISRLAALTRRGGTLLVSVPNLSCSGMHERTQIDACLTIEQMLSLIGGGGLGSRNGVWYFDAPLLFDEINKAGFELSVSIPIDTVDKQRRGIWWIGRFSRCE